MNAWQTLLVGVDPGHVAGLAAGLVAALVLPFLRGGPAHVADRWAVTLLGVSGAIHLALPLGHGASPLLTTGFVVSGLLFALLAFFAHTGRGWRVATLLLVPATLVGYLIVVVGGGEEADQVGVATALVELAAFGIALRGVRGLRVAGTIAVATGVAVFGAIVWVSSFVAHRAADAHASAPSVSSAHGHEHIARTQAGVIMRPWVGDHHPTSAQTAAAAQLAAATRQGVRRYARLADALAAGYTWPLGKRTGADVHLEHSEYKKDGRVLDPERPEMLVYAIEGGRAVLLGVVFVMEEAGVAGPAPGGPVTRWHAHNLCVSVVPPGIGIVTPYGGCPALSLTTTIPEMMHVWIVAPPGGPFAEGVDEAWARDYLRLHGIALL